MLKDGLYEQIINKSYIIFNGTEVIGQFLYKITSFILYMVCCPAADILHDLSARIFRCFLCIVSDFDQLLSDIVAEIVDHFFDIDNERLLGRFIAG